MAGNAFSLFGTIGADLSDLESALQQAKATVAESAASIEGSFSGIGGGAVDASSGVAGFGEAAQGSVSGAHEAASAAEGLHESLAGVGEAALSVAEALGAGLGLAELTKEALAAFSATQDLETTLKLLSGDAVLASEQVETLKGIAQATVTPFDQLAAAARKMASDFGSFDLIKPILSDIADAANRSGRSFEAMANMVDRIVQSGALMSRSLTQLGISIDAVGEAMNMTGDEAKKAFAELDVTDRLAVLQVALAKTAGASEEFTHNLSGEWTTLKNNIDFALEDIGKALEPLASEFLSAFGDIASAAKPLLEALEAIAGVAIGELVSNIKGLDQAVSDFATAAKSPLTALAQLITGVNDFSEAVKHLTGIELSTWLTEAGKAAVDYLTHFNEIAGVLNTVTAGLKYFGSESGNTSDQVKVLKEHSDALGDSLITLHPKIKETGDKFKDADDELDKFGSEVEKLTLEMPDAFEKAGARIDKAITFEKFEKGLVDLDTVVNTELANATKPLNKFIDTMQHSAAGMTENGQKIIGLAKDMKEGLRKFIEDRAFEDLTAAIDKYTDKSNIDAVQIQNANLEILTSFEMVAQAKRDTDAVFSNIFDPVVQQSIALNTALHTLKIDGMEGISTQASRTLQAFDVLLDGFDRGVVDADSLDAGYKRVYDSLVRLGTTRAMQDLQIATHQYVQDLIASDAPLGKIYDAQAKALQQERDMVAARGGDAKAALDLTIQLEQVRIKQDILHTQSMGLSDLFTGVVHSVENAWGSAQKGLADAIVAGHGFGDVMDKVLTDLETKLAEVAVKYITDQLLGSLLKSVDAAGLLGKVLGGIGIPGFGGSLPSIGGAGSGTPGVGVPGAGSGAGGATDAAGGLSGVIGQGVSAGLSSVVSAVTGVVSAVTGVVSVFQNMHQETSLNAIEHNTRYSMEYLGERGDGGIVTATLKTKELMGYAVTDLDDIKASLWSVRASTADILPVLTAIRDNTAKVTADKATAAASGATQAPLSVHLTFNGPVVGGDAGMRELTDKIWNDGVDKLRQARIHG